MSRTIPLLLVVLAACGDGKQKAHEEHDDDHAAGEHTPGEAAHAPGEPGLLRVDRGMLRDLRLTTAKAEARAAGERVSVLGELTVDQDTYAEVAAPSPARVVKVLVKPGDRVTVNQPLVELHSADLGKARAEALAARARADLAAKSVTRKRTLATDQLITDQELRDAEAAATLADADLKVAQAAVRSFGEGGGDAARFVLRAPVAGTVIDRNVVTGQLADPSRTLLTVGDLSHLWLIAHVFERDAVRLRVGGTAQVAFAALPGRAFSAEVALIGSGVDPSSRTIPVRLELANPDGTLRPGMSATASLPLGDATGAAGGTVVAVPLASVQRVGDGWAVFLPKSEEGSFEIRPIGRGRELGGEVEILSGLTADETVVVDGAFLLKAESDKARGEGGGHDHH